MFIDKNRGLVTKTSTVTEQMGTSIAVETFMSDYTTVNGVVFPQKISASVMGMETVITFDQIEVDIPMDDEIFTVK
jgi:hypothetical protein